MLPNPSLTEPQPPPRFAALDGLRGLAALMVALSHYVLAFQPALLGGGTSVSHFDASQAIGRSGLILLYNPELGVAIFFVLSGFVLSASMARASDGLAVLVARRWVRLALPILGTSLLIWPLAEFHLFRSVAAAGLAKSDWLGGNYAWLSFESNDFWRLVYQSLLDIFVRSRDFYNTALWTMPTEFWGSIGLFAGYAAIRLLPCQPVGRTGLALAVALAVLVWQWHSAYSGFAWGVLLFEAYSFDRLHGRVARLAGLLGLAAGVLLGGMPFAIDLPGGGLYARLFLAVAPFDANPVLLLHRLAAVCLVAAALLCRPLQRMLATDICRFLGRVSFMLYLVHVPLLCAPAAALVLLLAPAIGYNAATFVLLPGFVASAIGLGWVCTLAIDEPAQKLSRRVRAHRRLVRWTLRISRPAFRRASPPATRLPSP